MAYIFKIRTQSGKSNLENILFMFIIKLVSQIIKLWYKHLKYVLGGQHLSGSISQKYVDYIVLNVPKHINSSENFLVTVTDDFVPQVK